MVMQRRWSAGEAWRGELTTHARAAEVLARAWWHQLQLSRQAWQVSLAKLVYHQQQPLAGYPVVWHQRLRWSKLLLLSL